MGQVWGVYSDKVQTLNREASQALVFKFMASGAPELTALSRNHHLTMWLCTNALQAFLDSSIVCTVPPVEATSVMSPEEADIAHYIGGVVCCKLKQRNDEYSGVINALVSSLEPERCTLLAAKSRGKLTNLTKDGKCLFVELEQVFRNLFPPSAVKVNVSEFFAVCVSDEVVQNCFHSATDCVDSDKKDKNLSAIIALYFKVRVQ